MPSPFPGMDPYLEHPSLWHGLHTLLISAIATALGPRIAPNYYVAVEQRTFVIVGDGRDVFRRPDVEVVHPEPRRLREAPIAMLERPISVELAMPEEVREHYLEIRDTKTHAVITAIEILSPANKQSGEGRREYEKKRIQVLGSLSNLVEIDLLRGGEPMPTDPAPRTHYRILISREWERPRARLYPFNLDEPIPEIPIPLRHGESEPTLDLGALLAQIYDQVRYDLRIDYASEPEPPLDPTSATWARDLLRPVTSSSNTPSA
ncbi:MAG: DUF4058 family protein [Chloroflexi bacterium]|nr:DUF4058 family protein [Chloroflexota bacterium]